MLGQPVALGTTVPGFAGGIAVEKLSMPAPTADQLLRSASSIPTAAEIGMANGCQLRAVHEVHLRSMTAAKQREHADFLYRSLRHKNISAVPIADHELVHWILQIQRVHLEPVLTTISPAPSVRGQSFTAPVGTVVRKLSPHPECTILPAPPVVGAVVGTVAQKLSPRPEHNMKGMWTGAQSLTPRQWVGGAPCATQPRSISPLPTPPPPALPTPPALLPTVTVSPRSMVAPSLQSYTPQVARAMPSHLPTLPPQPTVNPTIHQSFLSRIDGAVADMERELDQNYDAMRDSPRQLTNFEHESTVDWLDKHISDLAFNRRQAEEPHSARSMVEPRIGHSRLSLLETEHHHLKRQVSEMELHREREAIERDRMDLERAHLAAIDSLEEERHQTSLLRQQCRKLQDQVNRTTNDEKDKLEQAAALASLGKQLQDQVNRTAKDEKEKLEQIAAVSAHVRRIAELEEELCIACNKHKTHEVRIRELEFENSTHQERIRVLVSNSDHVGRQPIDGNNHQHSTLVSRIADLESELEHRVQRHEETLKKHHEQHRNTVSGLEQELAEAKNLEGALTREKHTHMTRALELETQLAEVLAGEDSHKRQHAQHKLKHSELEQLLQEQQEKHMAEITQHRSRHNDLERQIEEYVTNSGSSQRQLVSYKNKLSDMEKDILEHEGEKETLKRHLQAARQDLKERDQRLADTELQHGSKSQQYTIQLAKIQELEQRLLDTEAAESGHKQKHTTSAMRITELENLLEDHKMNLTREGQKHATSKSRIVELEGLLEEHKTNFAREGQKHATSKSRIVELEGLLEEHQANLARQNQKHESHKSRIVELEGLLEDHKTNLAREGQKHEISKSRIVELEQLLEDAESGKSTHQRQSQTHKSKVSGLEQLVEEMQLDVAKHLQKQKSDQQRILQLEQEAEESEARHRRLHQTKDKNLADLQERYAGLERIHVEVQRKHETVLGEHRSATLEVDELRVRVKEIESGQGSSSEQLQQDLRNANDARLQAQDEVHRLQNEVQQLLKKVEQVEVEKQEIEQDVLEATSFQDRKVQDLEAQSKDKSEKLRQEQVRVEQLELKIQEMQQTLLAQKQRPSRPSSPQVTFQDTTPMRYSIASNKGSSARMSIFIDKITERRQLFDTILPGKVDPFLDKVRDALKNSAEAHNTSSQTHMMAIEHQLAAMSKARDTGNNPMDALHAYTQKAIVESEQKTALSNVEAAAHELKSLLQELEVNHQFSQAEHDEIQTKLTDDLRKCNDEQMILMDASSVASLDEWLVHELMDIHDNGVIDKSRSWDGGLSPVHYMAKLGRRDVLQYLLSKDGASDLLYVSDAQGRTPLFYASKHLSVAHWLEDFADVSKPMQMHNSDRRPSVSMIPPQYLNLLHQIEKSGWNYVNWKNGFTMLHWAANKGDTHAELCNYLMSLHGDPNMEDSQHRTPLSLAREGGHLQVVGVLEDRLRRGSIAAAVHHTPSFAY